MVGMQGDDLEAFATALVQMQIAFYELDADKLMRMPATRFDLIVEELSKQNKKMAKTPNSLG